MVGNLERSQAGSPGLPYCLAIGYASVGDVDRAFESLERAYSRHVSLLDLLLIECASVPAARIDGMWSFSGRWVCFPTPPVQTWWRGYSFSTVLVAKTPAARD